MKFDILTIFPKLFDSVLSEGLIAKAIENRVLNVSIHDLRNFASDSRGSVDDVPYGGGPGMVMNPKPFVKAVRHIRNERGVPDAVVLLSPQGKIFSQETAVRLSHLDHVVLLCGRYEGIDERVSELVATEEISIGDYVLTGGELPALVVLDSVGRQIPGVVGQPASVENDSFTRNLLDWPHYTRPADLDGSKVPDVLLSGNHAEIRLWRKRAAVMRTMERRPDLLRSDEMDLEELEIFKKLCDTIEN